MKRILSLFLLSAFCLMACGAPIVNKSHENSRGGAESKAMKEAGSDSD